MFVQSDAAKAHIEKLLNEAYIPDEYQKKIDEWLPRMPATAHAAFWHKEYRFAPPRRWAFDYAVPAILCANSGLFLLSQSHLPHPRGVIEIDGGTFQSQRTGHSSGVGLRAWREKHNAAMNAGWKVYHFAPEEVIKAGRKIWNPIDIEKDVQAGQMRNPAR